MSDHSPRSRLVKIKVQQLTHHSIALQSMVPSSGVVRATYTSPPTLAWTLQTQAGKATARSEHNSPQHPPCTEEVWLLREIFPLQNGRR